LAAEELVELGIPEADAPSDPGGVADDANVRRHLDGEFAGVASPDIEHVAASKLGDGVDHLAYAAVPASRPLPGQCRLADVLVVGLGPAHGVLPELEMQQQPAGAEQRA